MTDNSQPSTDGPRGLTRRTFTRGAAWTVPIVAASVAAPAFAASTDGPLGIAQLVVTYGRGDFASNSFALSFTNPASQDAYVTRLDMYTTFHAPAVNPTTARVWSTAGGTPFKVPAGTTANDFVGWEDVPGDTAWIIPPKDADGTSLLPSYYTDYDAGDTDGTIACTGYRFPADPLYPPNCKRLAADGTHFVLHYTIGGDAKQLALTPTGFPCNVIGACV